MKLPSFIIFSSAIALVLIGCQSSDQAYQEIVNGQIAYPFYNTTPLGRDENRGDDKFVIRTISGSTEYVVEIPGAAQDYDVEVPIASMDLNGSDKTKVKNAQLTDRELVASMPKIDQATEDEKALMDRAYGVGERGGPRQSPSYTLGINKINNLYRLGKYELALVEINNLLAFFPTSVKLYKMKGTTLVKLRNFELAERAWLRAGDLAPQDAVIKKGLNRLKRTMAANELHKKAEISPSDNATIEGDDSPAALVAPAPNATEPASPNP